MIRAIFFICYQISTIVTTAGPPKGKVPRICDKFVLVIYFLNILDEYMLVAVETL